VLYLSEDDVLDGEDRQLASVSRSQAVAPGESYSPTRTVTIPNVPAGTYYLIVRTDVYDYVYEADETNNVLAAVPVDILTPDLIPVGLTAPASVVTEHQVEVSWTVENQGTGEAQASWYDVLYLSEDDVLDGEDRQLASVSRSQAVAPGESYSPTRTVTIPKVPAGTYYLIVRTDVYDYVYEADETNNVTSREIYVSSIETFRIVTIAATAGGRLRIDFTNDAGRLYGLESRDSMGEGDWAAEQFFLTEGATEPRSEILGTGDVLSIYVSPTANSGFYRMVAP
jgi:subtilase family serine protease